LCLAGFRWWWWWWRLLRRRRLLLLLEVLDGGRVVDVDGRLGD
jgi:hypothetical protein